MSWSCDGLRFEYRGAARAAIDDVSIDIEAGACTAVLGPNGSGKSTLLRLLLGTLEPDAGEISFAGRRVRDWPRTEIARTVGVVPQSEEMPFPLTVREMVAMGRYPHLGPWRREGARDRAAIDSALERCDVAHFAGRAIATLSGGERQRARIARALAQQPRALALDEPTIALDVRHEMAIFELLRALVAEGVTVVVITHNLNLAARYADRLILLDAGRVAGSGGPADVIRPDLLESVYRWPVSVWPHPGPGRDAGTPQVTPIADAPVIPAKLVPDSHPGAGIQGA
jgi:iron complex transport system ATP-binding protein